MTANSRSGLFRSTRCALLRESSGASSESEPSEKNIDIRLITKSLKNLIKNQNVPIEEEFDY